MQRRPPHPSNHDPLTHKLLQDAMDGEVLVPCEDKASALVVRSRLYALVRAFKDWDLPEYNTYKHLRTKMLTTSAVLSKRDKYMAEATEHPITLVLDSRDGATKAMEAAMSTNSAVPMTRKPDAAYSTFDDDKEEDDDSVDDNLYANIIDRMSR